MFHTSLLPIRGQCEFLLRPRLWKHVVAPFFVTGLFTFGALFFLFSFTYWPQVLQLKSLGIETTTCGVLVGILILLECSVLTLVVFTLLFGAVIGQIMISVLEERGVAWKVLQKFGVELKDNTMIGDACDAMAFQLFRVPLMIVSGPLLGIPAVGPVLWQLVNGGIYTWELIANLLPFIGYGSFGEQFGGHVLKHLPSYCGFGSVALLLQMIPFVNVIFVFGNAVGAALLFEDFVEQAPQRHLLKVDP